MTLLLAWIAALLVLVVLIGLPLVLGRLLADRDRAIETVERSALEAEALALMVGQPVEEVSSVGEASSPVEAASPVEDSAAGADGHDASPM
jgi:hypothetical protein